MGFSKLLDIDNSVILRWHLENHGKNIRVQKLYGTKNYM